MLGLARTGPRREHRCCGFFELCQKHLIRCCWRPPDLWELDGGRECGVAYAICSFDIDSRSATSSAESTLFCSCSSMLLLTCLASVSALCGTLKPDRLEELLAREAGVELASLGVSGCIGSGVNAAHLTEGARRGPEPGSAAAAAWRRGGRGLWRAGCRCGFQSELERGRAQECVRRRYARPRNACTQLRKRRLCCKRKSRACFSGSEHWPLAARTRVAFRTAFAARSFSAMRSLSRRCTVLSIARVSAVVQPVTWSWLPPASLQRTSAYIKHATSKVWGQDQSPEPTSPGYTRWGGAGRDF